MSAGEGALEKYQLVPFWLLAGRFGSGVHQVGLGLLMLAPGSRGTSSSSVVETQLGPEGVAV